MKIQFYLRYHTRFGESLHVCVNQGAPQPLNYLNDELWEGAFEIDPKKNKTLHWSYVFQAADGSQTAEWENNRQIDLSACHQNSLQICDTWNPASAVENVFYTQPFQVGISPASGGQKKAKGSVLFRVKAPTLRPDEVVCLTGHGAGLRNWDNAAPFLLEKNGDWWSIRLDLSAEHFPLGYKYGIWNTRTHRFLGFEEGINRTLLIPPQAGNQISALVHDGFLRVPSNTWRAAGVSIPVFSLRSEKSWGIGEFTDLPLLADWAKSVGMKMIQLLPINDTTSTHTWTDSYPYAPVSVFALHPIYLNLEQLAGKKHAALLKPLEPKRKQLNSLESVDYESVLQLKWDVIRKLYDLLKTDWQKDDHWLRYYAENKHWLDDYALFCWLRDTNGTPEFNLWPKHAKYDAKALKKLLEPSSLYYDQIALHLFVQWHLHLQLKSAVDYVHALGIALKGDLPIGIYRHSVDAWVAPELYNMNTQAGAPPDPFAEKGQNWGFPTYNWAKMKEDGFAWWKQRFEQLSHYFDAFRIDHILGFFRIWSIPLDAVEGILGVFSPALPLTETELREAGVGFSFDRLCKPYITEHILHEIFGNEAAWVAQHCLKPRSDGRFDLIPAFSSQQKTEAYFKSIAPDTRNASLKQGLFDLIANVVLLGDEVPKGQPWQGAFRFDMEKTSSFRDLPHEVKEPLKQLYVNYFYRRQDDFWKNEAMEKLPALKRASNMLICGEDLGLVPACVPGVMRELGLLSLEIQRMPKAPGSEFFHPKDAPYLSVVTPGTHDMSVLRGWWEEDRNLTQRFYNNVLNQQGDAPYFCEPWVVQLMLAQHLHAPAMWAVFQLQDLLGMDGALRRENPHDERINIPANPKHYWQYRMHLSLEQLLKADSFKAMVAGMVRESGRN
ncbi:MAG: 4-alpha-glucanotransferase [Saprospiraceae bacterium]|nr:4-alpha-glucanotransferase [Saprospiraceae bacterium]